MTAIKSRETKHIEWLDTGKGILILLVVLGHAISQESRETFPQLKFLYELIYRFHMPAFMFLSGITFKISRRYHSDRRGTAQIRYDVKKLLLPYVVYGSIVYLVFTIVALIPQINQLLSGTSYRSIPFVEWVWSMVKGVNPYCIHIWFIYALFLMHLFIDIIEKIVIKNSKLILIGCGIALLLFKFVVGTDSWGILNYICCYFIFFIVGYFFSFEKTERKNKYVYIGIVCIILLAIRLFVNFTSPIKWIRILISVMLTVIQFGAVLGIVGSSICICDKMSLFTRVGRNSWYIYLFHQPFTTAVAICLMKILVPSSVGTNFLIVFLVFGLAIVFSLVVKTMWEFIKKHISGKV